MRGEKFKGLGCGCPSDAGAHRMLGGALANRAGLLFVSWPWKGYQLLYLPQALVAVLGGSTTALNLPSFFFFFLSPLL